MRTVPFFLLMVCIPLGGFAQTEEEPQESDQKDVEEQAPAEVSSCEPAPVEEVSPCKPEKKWYFEVMPGYYYFTDSSMRQFFDQGGFTIRGQTGYKFWGPLTLWIDGGYFQKHGSAIGGSEKLKIMLATITMGLKLLFYPHDRIALYAGAGPRLFLMKLHNDSPFVRSEDNEIGIGGGFNAGFWVFPIPQCPNIFIDFFADYSWKKMSVAEDEISSGDSDVDVSGLTGGIGLGFRF